MALVASEEAILLLGQFRISLRLPSEPERPSDELFARDYSRRWEEFAEWSALAVPTTGGEPLGIRDLIDFTEEFSQHLLPIPFLTTLLVARWTGRAPQSGEAWTFQAPRRSGGSLIPFADWPRVLRYGASSDAPAQEVGRLQTDRFAPSLPIAESSRQSDLNTIEGEELRTLCAAAGVGVGSRILSEATRYSTQREAFGRPIAQFQALRHLMADMKRDLEIARTAAIYSAHIEQGSNHKVVGECLRLCLAIAGRGVQLFGGIGFTWELGLHFMQRHLVALRQLADVDG